MKNRKTLADAGATAACGPYADRAAFLDVLRQGFEALSRQLKAIGRHVEMQGDRLAFDGIQATAEQCGVQPSAVVRFAKHFGFSGYSELQALFRADAARQLSAQHDYQDRIRGLIASGNEPRSSARLAHEVIEGSIESLQALQRGLPPEQFEAAVDLMLDAPSLWLAASRRAFPVGAYLAYALQHTEKPVHWLHGLGAMQKGELRALSPGDVMLAVSFEPYAPETLEVVDAALARGARLLALTDSQLSPLASRATVTLLAQDAATFGFRSLTSTLTLAQSLFLALAYRMELAYEPSRKP
ncbi:MurR/RpiR family transcriptional regulator [Delftia tsuruhatensis]|uniref:MurR/RpiR family transcriptional regulator n=1 Tax=Delftia TaxID=80865 RepID=UPI000926E58F|nr:MULTISPECIES: MurR/RpiR family transcriptional regulator [Delftia]MDH0417919.1 MurR/RpiR family transcriptional regulator [Delftia tsuruhatensis]MDH0771862.1 MurR/RpiR family transcriptional regulator [Delftia tsuruhatensis]MDH1456619.1 MurR/RpiR family transcriptional regulator [Delftia tsuruhatensis]MDH1822637.1 MurR/RpiR family transcriptional regulator [Delftia tsuruhatensis]OJX13318.1 MAG: RpiR family transcriptional regulator [Delftia sp. 67-8]